MTEISITAAVNGQSWKSMPLAPRETKFSADDAITRILAWSNGSASKFSSAFLWRSDESAVSRNNYRLPIADIHNGKLTLIPRAVFSAAVILSGGHGGLEGVIKDEGERRELKQTLTEIYDVLQEEYQDPRVVAPWLLGRTEEEQQEIRQSLESSIMEGDMDPFGQGVWTVEGLVASVNTSWSGIGMADVDHPWDGEAARKRVWDWSEGDFRRYRRAFLWYDSARPDQKNSYKLPIADVIDDDLKIVPRAVNAVAAVLGGARGGVDIPDEDMASVERVVKRLQAKFSEGRESVEAADSFGSGRSTTIDPWMELNAYFSRASIASNRLTAGAPGLAAYAGDASIGGSGAGLRSRTSSAQIAEMSLRHGLDSGKRFDAGRAGIEDSVTARTRGHETNELTTPNSEHGRTRPQGDPAQPTSAGVENEQPTGGTRLESLNSSGSTLMNFSNDKVEDVAFVTAFSNSTPDALGLHDRHTSTIATPREESDLSCVRPATEALAASSTTQPSWGEPLPTFSTPAPASPSLNRQELLRPPESWFREPIMHDLMPFTVFPDGRVAGLIATFGRCHAGIMDECVMAPRSATGYKYFLNGQVLTSSGKLVRVGKITMGTGHAGPNMRWMPAADHYDNTGTVSAVVAVGENRHGIWAAGALVPDITEEGAAELRRSPISGDWRRINGNLELVAALAVNTPGFPIVASINGEPQSLVAAGMLVDGVEASVEPEKLTDVEKDLTSQVDDLDRKLTELAAKGRNRKWGKLMAALDERKK